MCSQTLQWNPQSPTLDIITSYFLSYNIQAPLHTWTHFAKFMFNSCLCTHSHWNSSVEIGTYLLRLVYDPSFEACNLLWTIWTPRTILAVRMNWEMCHGFNNCKSWASYSKFQRWSWEAKYKDSLVNWPQRPSQLWSLFHNLSIFYVERIFWL